MSDPPTERPSSSDMLQGLNLKALLSSGLSVGDADEVPPEIPGYEVIERIGRGGMGSVYLAEQLSLSRLVAVKVIAMKPSATADQRDLLLSRLESEALIMAKLDHPNLVAVFDFIKLATGDAAIVMERVAGGSVRDYIRKPAPVPVETVITIGEQVASCLTAAHAAGVIHRDIKPENLLVAANGTVKVSDFGLALDADSLRLTASGLSVGTLGYSAPEQLEGAETDERSDIYSLGVVLYELLTGLKPMGNMKRPGAIRDGVPGWLERTILNALQSDRDRRISTASELQQRLASSAPPNSRRRWMAAAAMLVAGSAGLGWWYSARPTLAATKPSEPLESAEPSEPAELANPDIPIHLSPLRGRWRNVGSDYHCWWNMALLGVTTAPDVMGRTIRLDFTRNEGNTPLGIFFRHPNGYGSVVLDAYRKQLSGVEAINGETLLTSPDSFDFRIENGRRYLWEVQLEPNRIRTFVDGELKQDVAIATEPLTIGEGWKWRDSEVGDYSIVIGSYGNLTTIHNVEVK